MNNPGTGNQGATLGNLLLKRGLISLGQLEIGLGIQKRTGERLGTALMRLGFLDGVDFVKLISEQSGIEVISVDNIAVDPRAVEQVPINLARTYHCVPLIILGGSLVVGFPKASFEDLDLATIQNHVSVEIEAVPIAIPKVDQVIERVYSVLGRRRMRDKKIGTYLIESGKITEEQLERAIMLQTARGERLGHILVSEKFTTEDDFHDVLAHRLGMSYLTRGQIAINLDREVALMIPKNFALYNLVLPLARTGRMGLAVINAPLDKSVVESLNTAMGVSSIEFYLGHENVIKELIENLHDNPEFFQQDAMWVKEAYDDSGQRTVIKVDPALMQYPPLTDDMVSMILDFLLYQAYAQEADEILIEREEGATRVVFKIHGQDQAQLNMPIDHTNVDRVINRVKLEAGLKLAERLIPQEGTLYRDFGPKKHAAYSLRLEPGPYGQNCTFSINKEAGTITTHRTKE
jgi:type IV pilus assembly protein PilB